MWDMDLAALSAERGLLVRTLRVAQLVFRGFKEDDLAVHASSLTFVTLTSLVPILAVAFAVLKGFGFGQDKINGLLSWTAQMPEEFQDFIRQMLEIVNSTNFAALGWIGLAILVLTAVMVLGSMEASFNRIWGIKRSRHVLRQIANYTSILVLVPLLIGVAGTVEASLKGGVTLLPDSVSGLARNLLGLTSLFMTWLAFAFLYVLVPNTRVRIRPALLGGLAGALLFMGWQRLYISLQIGVARYNAIYGTFASVPIFLAWLFVSWVIVLLGAEFTFALQNSSTFQMESAADRASAKAKLMLALSIMRDAAIALAEGRPRFETSAYARAHRVPIRLLNEMVRLLVRRGLLAEMAEKQGSYVLLKAPATVPLREIVNLVFQEGAQPEFLGLQQADPAIAGLLDTLTRGMDRALEPLTLADLLPGGRGATPAG